jgi:hypothetical protein
MKYRILLASKLPVSYCQIHGNPFTVLARELLSSPLATGLNHNATRSDNATM